MTPCIVFFSWNSGHHYHLRQLIFFFEKDRREIHTTLTNPKLDGPSSKSKTKQRTGGGNNIRGFGWVGFTVKPP
jgi:hypothetical protein